MRRSIALCGLAILIAAAPSFAQAKTPDIPEGKALIYVYASPDFLNPYPAWIFTSNGPVAVLTIGYYTYFFEEPGTHNYWPVLNTVGNPSSLRPIPLDVVAGQTYYLKVNIRGVGKVFTAVQPETAKSEMKSLRSVTE